MFRKIVSGGDKGVELAAMDLALRLGIDCGGWTPKKNSPGQDQFNRKYHLRPTPGVGYQHAVEMNMADADGMLLITRGEKNQKAQHAVRMALKLHKQLLHVDLKQYSEFEAASLVSSWMQIQSLNALYITGATDEQDKSIYFHTQKILETAFYLDFVKSGLHPDTHRTRPAIPQQTTKAYPRTLQEAVDRLKSELPLKDRTLMANMQASDLGHLRDSLGEYIKQTYGLYGANDALMQSCAEAGRLHKPLPDEICQVILRHLWQDLQKTHKLRVIK